MDGVVHEKDAEILLWCDGLGELATSQICILIASILIQFGCLSKCRKEMPNFGIDMPAEMKC